VLNLFEHGVFNNLGRDRLGRAALPAASVGAAAEIVAVTLAVMATRGRRHGAAAGRTVKQSLQEGTGAAPVGRLVLTRAFAL
jgi:hypothetical protein